MRASVILAVCAMGLVGAAGSIHAAEPSDAGAIAVVTEVVGSAEIRRSNGPGWEKASPDDRLSVGDSIRTGKASRAAIETCGTTQVLQAEAELRITARCRLHVEHGKIFQQATKGPSA